LNPPLREPIHFSPQVAEGDHSHLSGD
jgi:hypothetical protein